MKITGTIRKDGQWFLITKYVSGARSVRIAKIERISQQGARATLERVRSTINKLRPPERKES